MNSAEYKRQAKSNMKLWHELSFEAKSIQLVDTDLKVAVSGNTVSGGHIQIISNEEGNISDIGKSFEGGKVFDIEVCVISVSPELRFN